VTSPLAVLWATITGEIFRLPTRKVLGGAP
jgi:hypothetical protein